MATRGWLERATVVLEGASEGLWLNTKDKSVTGDWAYLSGDLGTVNIPSGGRVLMITAIASDSGGTISINSGSNIVVPHGSSLTIEPKGNLIAPEVVFTGTETFFIEYVT